MNNVKKLLIVVVSVLVTSTIFAQDFRLRAFSSTYSYMDINGEFNDLKTNEHPSNILIVIAKNTITVYAKQQTIYSIVAIESVKYDEIGPYSLTSLLDDEGIQCIGKIYVPNETNTYHLIIQYKNVMFIYNCKEE
jgi:hypothetical protein